jgi:penicillin-binding protein 2
VVRDRLDGMAGNSAPPGGALRLLALRVITLIIFGLLLLQVWRLQFLQGKQYAEMADGMRFRQVELATRRGVIYDRDGEILVRNVPSFDVTIIPAELPDEEEEIHAIINRLTDLFEVSDNRWLVSPIPPAGLSQTEQEQYEAEALAASLRSRAEQMAPIDYVISELSKVIDLAPYKPIIIKQNISREAALILEEELLSLPGVHLEVNARREYPTAELTSHVLGYVGPIPSVQLEEYQAEGYKQTDRVGLTGIELAYEAQLRGMAGQKVIEVDVAGREVRTIGDVAPPVPGHNLVLTLDMDLQKIVEDALRRGLQRSKQESGVAIVMNPNTGEILAMSSLPSYDNNLFAVGISWRDYERLATDRRRPLVNHAISGQYPPGSVFKIVPASAALQEGVVTEDTIVTCQDGVMYLPNQYYPDDPDLAQKFVCWIHKSGFGHGPTNVIEALAQSCDIYFYHIGGGFEDFKGLGLENLAYYSHLFGFGEYSGIDLPGETRGLIPSARWKRLNYAESWVTGDTYNMAIGQGFVLASPLQVVNSFAAIANGGTLYQPHLARNVTDDEGQVVETFNPVVIRQLPLAEDTMALVQEGLAAVIDHGTARRVALQGITVAGKTGTAEYAGPRDARGNLPTHAWFAAYAPFESPEIAVVAFIDNGGEGSEMAAPVVAEILSAYFETPLVYVED